jgi:hypothetical protein
MREGKRGGDYACGVLGILLLGSLRSTSAADFRFFRNSRRFLR